MMKKKTADDFNWETYHQLYENELNTFNYDVIISDIDKNNFKIKDNLHPNHMELYYQIQSLDIGSVFECGFGCGHHLINIFKIKPNLLISGCDYSIHQMNIGVKYFKLNEYEFFNNLMILDFSKLIQEEHKLYDFVFTQAVTMHLEYNKALKFLFNMKKISSKYVFLIENLNSHNYNELIDEVFPEYERISTSKYINYGILLKKPD